MTTPSGQAPYNDLEFYVLVRGSALLMERRYREPLHRLGERLSPSAGLEVEFKVLTVPKLERAEPSMFYYDLVAGHRQLLGDSRWLDGCSHHRRPDRIPLHEATRLLMNRCSGLLFSLERLERPQFGEEESDFVGRNLAKLQLALGDVVVTCLGQYHWSCRERHQRLCAIPNDWEGLSLTEIRRNHQEGVRFKLHPTRSVQPRAILLERFRSLSELSGKLWLWLESRRLGCSFSSAADYALSQVNKCPEQPGWRNRLVNARDSGLNGLTDARYPRQRLLHALCLLLWSGRAPGAVREFGPIQKELQTDIANLPGLAAAYELLWHRYH